MKNVLITGASRGIGKCIAETLKKNYNVFATSRNEELLKKLGVKDCCVCDLTQNTDSIIEFIDRNNIDILINNAGEYIYNNIELMNQNEIERLLKLNLEIPIILSSACIKHMKANKWGRIINIGSISGVMGEAYASVYSASKAGLIGLSKALGLELAEYGITVNTINPGWVETDLGLKSIEESEFTLEETLQTIPQKRFVHPQEISDIIDYLISDKAKGITGQAINICAGLSVGI